MQPSQPVQGLVQVTGRSAADQVATGTDNCSHQPLRQPASCQCFLQASGRYTQRRRPHRLLPGELLPVTDTCQEKRSDF